MADTSDAGLQRLHQRATAARSRRDCPSSETLGRAAAGELAQAEREQVADHLAACADCAGELRAAASMRAWADSVAPLANPRRVPGSLLAAAAAVVIAVSAGAWSYFELQRARGTARLAQDLAGQSRQEAAALRRALDQLSQPQVDLLVADLYPPDGTRGTRESGTGLEQVITVPAGARLFSVILNVAEPSSAPDHGLEIRSEAGGLVWQGRGLHPGRFNTFSLALPRTLLPAGRYRFVLTAVDAGGERAIQEYPVRLQYE